MSTRKQSETERWGTRIGVILAVAGSAVGLGNFLRFPGQAVANGGGAFMIPYLCAVLLLGVPIGWAEWTMGRYGGQRGAHSAPRILALFGGGGAGRYLGALGLLIPFVVFMYYISIESWCLRYAWIYAMGGVELGADPEQYIARSTAIFERTSGSTANGVLFTSEMLPALGFWALTLALNLWLLCRGVSRGIERFCQIALPMMGVCALVVLARVLTLGTPNPALPHQNVQQGLGFMWNPDFSRLGDFQTWLAAAGQVFFSLSVGFGVILNYASYMRKDDDVVLSNLTAASTNELFEVGFGGLITITAAFVFLGASGTSGGTFGLGFVTLPVVFTYMGAWGRWIGAIWFFMLFLAAATSSISMLQPVSAFLTDEFRLKRGAAAAIVSAASGIGSAWVLYFSHDLVALGTMDFWVGTVGIFLLAGVQIICFGWVFGMDRAWEEAHVGAKMPIPRFYRVILKYVAPAYLLIVFVGFCVQQLPGSIATAFADDAARNTLVFIGCVLLLLIGLIRLGERSSSSA